MSSRIELIALDGVGEVVENDDLAALIADAATTSSIRLTDGDVVVVTQKIVSKAEGRLVDLASVEPSDFAREWASRWTATHDRSSSYCGNRPPSCAWRAAD